MAMSVEEFTNLVYGTDPGESRDSNKDRIEKGADSTLERLDKYVGSETVAKFIEDNLTRLYMETLFRPGEQDAATKLTDPRVIALGMFILGMRCEAGLSVIEALNDQFEV